MFLRRDIPSLCSIDEENGGFALPPSLFASFLSTLPPPQRGENCKINRAKWSFHGSHRVSALSAAQEEEEGAAVEPPAPPVHSLFQKELRLQNLACAGKQATIRTLRKPQSEVQWSQTRFYCIQESSMQQTEQSQMLKSQQAFCCKDWP